MVLMGLLGVPALAENPGHGDIHMATVAFTLAPEAAIGDVDNPWTFFCLCGQREGQSSRVRVAPRTLRSSCAGCWWGLTAYADATVFALPPRVGGVAPGPLGAVRVAAVVVIQPLVRVPGPEAGSSS